MNRLNILVLFGGQSSEHEVSLVSATNVLGLLNPDKYHVVKVGITKDGKWLRYEERSRTDKRWKLGKGRSFSGVSDARCNRWIIPGKGRKVGTY